MVSSNQHVALFNYNKQTNQQNTMLSFIVFGQCLININWEQNDHMNFFQLNYFVGINMGQSFVLVL